MTTKYPMLVMKIETFLGMKTLQSHQEMLVAKTLLPFNRSTMTGRVIFVSHQVRMVDRTLKLVRERTKGRDPCCRAKEGASRCSGGGCAYVRAACASILPLPLPRSLS